MDGTDGLDWVRGTSEPLKAESHVVLRGWADAALDNPDDFAAGLSDLGLGEDVISDGLGIRAVGAEELRGVEEDVEVGLSTADLTLSGPSPQDLVRLGQARRAAVGRLHNWWADRRIVALERYPVKLRLPLFVLGAPAAAGATVTFDSTTEQAKSFELSVSLAGTGLGTSATVNSTVTATFEAGGGETKLVFLPVTVAVEKIQTGGGVTSMRVSFDGLPVEPHDPGLLLLDPDAKPSRGELVSRYQLAGDSTGAPAVYRITYSREQGQTINVGLKAFGADISMKYSTKLKTSLGLTFRLPGGRDYEQYRPAQYSGVLWGN